MRHLLNDKLNGKESMLMIGKALLLSQKFENTCKDFVMWMSLTEKAAIEKEYDLLSLDYKDYVEILINQILGQNINNCRNYFKNEISVSEIEVLRKAKDARNYICHESTISFLYPSKYSCDLYEWNIPKLREMVADLAEGDYFASRWLYEFLEEEPGRSKDRNNYVEEILNWVFNSN
jgi:hypothetical protein